MEINCNGRRAVVSAAGSGIGRTIAEKLADNGAQVFVCDIVPKFLDDLAQKRPEIGSVIADVGQSGNATGPHLHVEVRHNGVARNPRDHIPGLGAGS